MTPIHSELAVLALIVGGALAWFSIRGYLALRRDLKAAECEAVQNEIDFEAQLAQARAELQDLEFDRDERSDTAKAEIENLRLERDLLAARLNQKTAECDSALADIAALRTIDKLRLESDLKSQLTARKSVKPKRKSAKA